jgi:putative spermidine/putrescine transport system substrate-binding protein
MIRRSRDNSINDPFRMARIGAMLIVLAGATSVFGQTLVVSGWGGLWEQTMRSTVIEPFQELNPGVEIIYTLNGGFAEMLARLRAERGNPTIDVFSTGGGFELIAADEALLEEFDPALMPNLGDVFEGGVYANRVVANSIAAVGLLYHLDRVPRAPTSWYDLWDPNFHPVAVSDISDTFGRALFARINELEGGTTENQEPAFEKFKELMRTQQPIINTTTDDTVTAIVSRGAAISVVPNSRAIQLIAEGYPAGFVYPEEGAFAWGTYMGVPLGSANRELAMQFIDFWLSPEVQQNFAAAVNYGPANTTVSMPDDYGYSEYLIFPEDIDTAYLLDYAYMNENLAAWSERWTQEVLPLLNR